MQAAKQTLLHFSGPPAATVGGQADAGAARAASAEPPADESVVRPRISLFPSEVPAPLAEDALLMGENAADEQFGLPVRTQPLWLKLVVVAVAASASLAIAFAFRPKQSSEHTLPAANAAAIGQAPVVANPPVPALAPVTTVTASDPPALPPASRALPGIHGAHVGGAKPAHPRTVRHSSVKRLGSSEIVDPWRK